MTEIIPTDPTFLDVILEFPDDSSLDPSARIRGASHNIIERDFESPGLSEVARYGGYSVYGGQSNTDAWVRTTLKNFSRERYDQVYGYTRRPEGSQGMYRSLLEFSEGKSEFHTLTPRQRGAMISAIKEARVAFKLPHKSEPLDWHEVGPHMRRDTAAGVTWMGKKKGEVMTEIYHEARWLGHRMKQNGRGRFNPAKMRFPPCVAGQRGAMSEADAPKTRLVFVYPSEMLAVEGFYAPVMYRKFMDQPDGPMLNGKSAQRLYTEWCVGLREGEKLYGLDFSKFDTKVPAWLIRVAFDILRQNITWDTFRGEPVSKHDRQKWRNVWDAMVWYFINTPILMPDGRMFRKRRGVPSGSWWTQMIDSVVNRILVAYLCNCQGVQRKKTKVLGDDGAFRSGEEMSFPQAEEDAACVGMVLNGPKCEKTSDPSEFKLLGTTYRDGHAHRPTEEWFKLALYPESSVSDLATSLTRLVGLWIGGAMWDREFCSFIEYFQSCFPCPVSGWFSKEQRRWLEVVQSGKAPRGWGGKRSLFWNSIFYTF